MGKRRIISIILVLILCSGFVTSCGNREDITYPITRISVIFPHSDDGYWSKIESGLEEQIEEGKKYGLDFSVLSPQLNYNIEQITDLVRQQIAAKVDVIVVQGNENEDFIKVLNEAYDNGIRIVLMDTDLEDFPQHLYIGTDNYQAGCEMGKNIAKIADDCASIAIVSGEKGYPNLEMRLKGIEANIGNNLKITQILYDNYDSITFMKCYYEAKDADVLVCIEGTGALTMNEVLKERGNLYKYIFGFDIADGIPKGITDGIMMQDTNEIGRQIVEQLIYYVQNGKYSSDEVYTAAQWVSAENYEENVDARE